MRLRDMNVYQLSSILFNITDLFEKDPILRDCNDEINEEITKKVFNPEMSLLGLRTRQSNITAVSIALMTISFVFSFFIGIPATLLFKEAAFVNLWPAISFSILGSSMYIAAFRAWRASLDEIKFKKLDQPKYFNLNKRAYIRWYDFLTGIPIGLFSLTWW